MTMHLCRGADHGQETGAQRRRQILLGAAAVLLLPTAAIPAFGQSARTPDPKAFESGDLLWPKKPGAFISYQYDSANDADKDLRRWNEERQAFLARVAKGEVSGGERVATEVRNLSYNEFRTRYLRNLKSGEITPYGSGGVVAVGHVAIVELDANKEPWVIEALVEPGVVRQRYSDWIRGRTGQTVWHGRIKNGALDQRADVAAHAARYVGKPYDFWNFDLRDERGFYCSKLVWLATMQALHVPIDGDPESSRAFWLSPKQILASAKVDRLFDPGDYATD